MKPLEEARTTMSDSVSVYRLEGETAETNFGANIATITVGEYALIVDTGMRPDLAKKVVEDVRYDGARKLTLVNTHHHGDHTICNQVFEREGARTVSHLKCRASISQLGDERIHNYASRSKLLGELYEGLGQTLPEITIDHSATIHLEDEPVIISHPGRIAHTQGDLYLYYPEEQVLFTGDLLFSQCHPNLVDGDVEGWIQTCGELSRLDASTVVPGHGPIATIKDLEAQSAYLQDLKDLVRLGFEQGDRPESIADKFLSKQPSEWRLKAMVLSNVKKLHEWLAKH